MLKKLWDKIFKRHDHTFTVVYKHRAGEEVGGWLSVQCTVCHKQKTYLEQDEQTFLNS